MVGFGCIWLSWGPRGNPRTTQADANTEGSTRKTDCWGPDCRGPHHHSSLSIERLSLYQHAAFQFLCVWNLGIVFDPIYPKSFFTLLWKGCLWPYIPRVTLAKNTITFFMTFCMSSWAQWRLWITEHTELHKENK